MVSPVNAILLIRGLEARGFPASAPKPFTILSTPAGRISSINSIRIKIPTGVCSAGLSTTQFPAASAGASFQVAISNGKFHGIICPTTPSGSVTFKQTVLLSSSLTEPSSALITPAKYLKWSTASGKSAAIVSRIALPLSQVSARASASRFCSITSAIFNNRLLR